MFGWFFNLFSGKKKLAYEPKVFGIEIDEVDTLIDPIGLLMFFGNNSVECHSPSSNFPVCVVNERWIKKYNEYYKMYVKQLEIEDMDESLHSIFYKEVLSNLSIKQKKQKIFSGIAELNNGKKTNFSVVKNKGTNTLDILYFNAKTGKEENCKDNVKSYYL